MRKFVFVFLFACQPPPVEQKSRSEVPEAVAVTAKPEVAEAPAQPGNEPVHKKPFCDTTFAANKAKKLAWPPSDVTLSPPLQRSGPVWVNFWAAWCAPCRAEIPTLEAWAKKWNVQLVFLSLDDDDRQWKQVGGKLGLFDLQPPFASGLIHGKAAHAWAEAVGASGALPAHAILDAQGRLRCKRTGAIEDVDPESLHAYLDSLR